MKSVETDGCLALYPAETKQYSQFCQKGEWDDRSDRIQASQFLEQITAHCTYVAKNYPCHLRGEAPAHTRLDELQAMLPTIHGSTRFFGCVFYGLTRQKISQSQRYPRIGTTTAFCPSVWCRLHPNQLSSRLVATEMQLKVRTSS